MGRLHRFKRLLLTVLILLPATVFSDDLEDIKATIQNFYQGNFDMMSEAPGPPLDIQPEDLRLFCERFLSYMQGYSLLQKGNAEEGVLLLKNTVPEAGKMDMIGLLALFQLYAHYAETDNTPLREEAGTRLLSIGDYPSRIEFWAQEADSFDLARFSHKPFLDDLIQRREAVFANEFTESDPSPVIEDETVDTENTVSTNTNTTETETSTVTTIQTKKGDPSYSALKRDGGALLLEHYYPYFKICSEQLFNSRDRALNQGLLWKNQGLIEEFILRQTADGHYFLQLGAFLKIENAIEEKARLEKRLAVQ